jgi:hypothetical protein
LAKKRCSSDDVAILESQYTSLENQLASVCYDYPRGSPKCHFPWWGILLIVVGGLFVIGLVGTIVYKRMRRNK